MDIRIQHIKIIKKSDVPHFYQEMLLTFTFNENSTSLKEAAHRELWRLKERMSEKLLYGRSLLMSYREFSAVSIIKKALRPWVDSNHRPFG